MMYVPLLTPLHLIVSVRSGSHSPFSIQMDVLEPMREYPGEEQPNIILAPGIAGST